MSSTKPPSRTDAPGVFGGLRDVLKKLAGIDDGPHAIALGLGIGLFLGVLPGTGPTAAIAVTWLFRGNKPATLVGSLGVNTWINVVAFPLALALGSGLWGIDSEVLVQAWKELWSNPGFERLWGLLVGDSLVLRALAALGTGYLIIGVVMGLVGYGLVRTALHFIPRKAPSTGSDQDGG